MVGMSLRNAVRLVVVLEARAAAEDDDDDGADGTQGFAAAAVIKLACLASRTRFQSSTVRSCPSGADCAPLATRERGGMALTEGARGLCKFSLSKGCTKH